MCFEKVLEHHCSVGVHTDDGEQQCCVGSDQTLHLDLHHHQEPGSHKDRDGDDDKEDTLLILDCCWRISVSLPRPSSGEDEEASCHDTNYVHMELPRK